MTGLEEETMMDVSMELLRLGFKDVPDGSRGFADPSCWRVTPCGNWRAEAGGFEACAFRKKDGSWGANVRVSDERGMVAYVRNGERASFKRRDEAVVAVLRAGDRVGGRVMV